jgi:hypothetical protein
MDLFQKQQTPKNLHMLVLNNFNTFWFMNQIELSREWQVEFEKSV